VRLGRRTSGYGLTSRSRTLTASNRRRFSDAMRAGSGGFSLRSLSYGSTSGLWGHSPKGDGPSAGATGLALMLEERFWLTAMVAAILLSTGLVGRDN
jgi:hypothetical protein